MEPDHGSKVRFLDNLRLEASFDDFKITTDQPVWHKGVVWPLSPFDYFWFGTMCGLFC